MDYEYKILEEKFKSLPKDLQEAISSTEVHDSIVNIGNKYGLHVDQLGQMVDLVGLIMLGLSPSKDFVRNFSQQSGVKNDIASSIAEDINRDVFDKIRTSMQSIEKNAGQSKESGIADLERIGGFSIEPTVEQDGSMPAQAIAPKTEEIMESKEDLVSGIENPIPVKQPIGTPEEAHTDIIVDHLLANPTGAAEQKASKTVEPPADLPGEEPLSGQMPEKPAPVSQPPKKQSGPDLYREPVE